MPIVHRERHFDHGGHILVAVGTCRLPEMRREVMYGSPQRVVACAGSYRPLRHLARGCLHHGTALRDSAIVVHRAPGSLSFCPTRPGVASTVASGHVIEHRAVRFSYRIELARTRNSAPNLSVSGLPSDIVVRRIDGN